MTPTHRSGHYYLNKSTMRVSKETAVLLKDAGYDVASEMYYDQHGDLQRAELGECDFNDSRTTYSAPTLHEAADWLRSKGVHLGADWDGDYWFWYITLLDNSDSIVGGNYDTHDSAYEAGIVHGLKYIK